MKKNGLSEATFASHESKLTGIDGHGKGYNLDLHAPAMAPKLAGPKLATAVMTPGRQASVQKAAAASVAKRRAAAAMKPKRGL